MTDREKFEAWYRDFFGREPLEIHWNIWQAALASQQPADDGWIEWAGGKRPVGKDVQVDVRFRTGEVHDSGSTAAGWRWSVLGGDYDIIAYRVVKP